MVLGQYLPIVWVERVVLDDRRPRHHGHSSTTTIWVVPSEYQPCAESRSGMVRGSGFSIKVLRRAEAAQSLISALCVHIFIDVHLCRPARPKLADAGFPAAEHWKVYLATMVIAFAAVVPFIIYAESNGG